MTSEAIIRIHWMDHTLPTFFAGTLDVLFNLDLDCAPISSDLGLFPQGEFVFCKQIDRVAFFLISTLFILFAVFKKCVSALSWRYCGSLAISCDLLMLL